MGFSWPAFFGWVVTAISAAGVIFAMYSFLSPLYKTKPKDNSGLDKKPK
jgi:hypothetical protein